MSLPLSAQIESVRAGSLLLASTELRGDLFQRTVVYILEHDDRGTFGLVVNRPTKVPVSVAAADWEDFVAGPPVVFNGGPVRKDGLLCLGLPREGAVEAENSGFSVVAPSIAVVNLESDAQLTASALEHVRIFAGYSGWAGGQLANEISRGSWYVAQGLPQDVFASPDVDLWAAVIRRHGARAGVLATHPIDTEVN
ncbi:MAG: YqgE/AlgH family protein [Segniliparus sp.]|uniref:YqgE/AlgH family protein n=1 Tax=Segniliparus sp. TaxID=2804064 RepID=UPI003F380F38